MKNTLLTTLAAIVFTSAALAANQPNIVIIFNDDQGAVRQGDWKYHSREIFKVKATTRKHKGPTLYNLKEDIGESNNLIDQHPEIAERLANVLKSNPNKRNKKK